MAPVRHRSDDRPLGGFTTVHARLEDEPELRLSTSLLIAFVRDAILALMAAIPADEVTEPSK